MYLYLYLYYVLVWKGTNLAQDRVFFLFFCVSNWICGVSACENRQNRVSHGESVRVGSSGTLRIPAIKNHNSLLSCFSDRTLAAKWCLLIEANNLFRRSNLFGVEYNCSSGFFWRLLLQHNIFRAYYNLVNLLGVFRWSSSGSCGCSNHRLWQVTHLWLRTQIWRI